MITMMTRQIRPIPIIRECATGRVPFGLIPVTAAIAVISTANPNQTIQLMPEAATRVEPVLLSCA